MQMPKPTHAIPTRFKFNNTDYVFYAKKEKTSKESDKKGKQTNRREIVGRQEKGRSNGSAPRRTGYLGKK